MRRARLEEVLALRCTSLAGTLARARALLACKPEVLDPQGAYDDETLIAQLVRAVLGLEGAE